MKKLTWIAAACLALTSCSSSNNEGTRTNNLVPGSDTAAMPISVDDTAIAEEGTMDDQYANYYVVIADTGNNYYELDRKMYALSNALKMEVDTMERYFDAWKKRIIVPETSEDEMYRGEYYPRLHLSGNLSLEYLSIYQEEANENTMALIGSICETRSEADSILTLISPLSPSAYTRLSRLYIGCMH